jgi:formate hydrogenlyase transcriptional activator
MSIVLQADPPELVRHRNQLRLLLEVSEAIASQGDLTGLFRDLARRLPAVLPFEVIALFLHDAEKDVLRAHMLGTAEADRIPPGMEVSLDDTYSGLAWRTQEPVVVRRADAEMRFPTSQSLLRDIGVESFAVFPLTTIKRRVGAIGFGTKHPCPFSDEDLDFLRQVSRQVAVAVDNVLHHASAEAARAELSRERDRLRLVLDVNNAVVSHLDLDEMFPAIAASLARVIPHDGCSLVLLDASAGRYRCHALKSGQSTIQEGRIDECAAYPTDAAFATKVPVMLSEQDLREMAPRSEVAGRLLEYGVKTFACAPLLSRDRVLGALNVGRLREDAFTPEEMEFLGQVAQQVAIAIENGLAYREIADLKERLNKERLYLEDEIRTTYNFGEIVGKSPALGHVLRQVEIVAPTDSTVLIQGETGTGKELIARAIHDLSGRQARTFVKLNCAAIPTGLLESELFGHEKGAFTGAISQKIGRFELAQGGTLFLDEVGDIPLELQSKFLRVLQEQEFERLGGTRTIRVDIRLVAATNRDLSAMVASREFRSDLYYRLNVFPIQTPPLRERAGDVPRLVQYFTQKFARRMKKSITAIPVATMEALAAYAWPGNVRELENFIERAVILTRGSDLDAPLGELKAPSAAALTGNGNGHGAVPGPVSTLEHAEREHIVRALREANWIVGGPSGAASRLGMKRTTLQSRMAKLGIEKPAVLR